MIRSLITPHVPVSLGALLREFGAVVEMAKPRVTAMVLVTTAAGFYLAVQDTVSAFLLLNALVGTGLLSAGTAVLNQYMERKADGRMLRTAARPLPTGRIAARKALWIGMALLASGTLLLALTTNLITAFLGWLTAFIYLTAYTPLKQRTHWCTVIGAIPGAIPPVMGWTAVRGTLSAEAFALFAILFCWQFPHFLAIALLYREDYARGGFRMLPEHDHKGTGTAFRIMVFSGLLVVASFFPYWTGMVSNWYLGAIVPLGAYFLWYGLAPLRDMSLVSARRLLKASVAYLPLLLLVLTVAKAG